MSKQRRITVLNERIVDLQTQVDDWKQRILEATTDSEIKFLRSRRDSTQSGIRHARQELRFLESGPVLVKSHKMTKKTVFRRPLPMITVEDDEEERGEPLSSPPATDDEPAPKKYEEADSNIAPSEEDSSCDEYERKPRAPRKRLVHKAIYPRAPNPSNVNASRQTLPAYFGPVRGSVLADNDVYQSVAADFWYLVPVENGFKIDLSRSYLVCDTVPSILGNVVILRGSNGIYLGSASGLLQVGYCCGTYAFLPRPLSFDMP